MTSQRFPGGQIADAAPDARYAVLIYGSHLDTSDGRIPLPRDQNVLYLRASWQGGTMRLVGCGHQDDLAWWWHAGAWDNIGASSGVNPSAFEPGAILTCKGRDICQRYVYDTAEVSRFALVTGSQGIRWVRPDGTIVTADSTYADPARGVYQFTDFGDVVFGEGDDEAGGGVVARFADDGITRRIEPGPVRFVRVQRSGDDLALAFARLDTRECVVTWTTLDEVRAWPPLVGPAVVQDIAPFDAHFYAAAYKDFACKAPANVAFAVEQPTVPLTGAGIIAPGVVGVDLARVIGWTTGIENVAATSAAALAAKTIKDVPVYAYMGGHVPESLVAGVDYPLIQAYRLPGYETAQTILAKLYADIDRCAYPRIGLAIDLTARTLADGVPWSEQDRIVFLMGIVELCREIRPTAVFAWAWKRDWPQEGIMHSPVITEQWRRFVAAIPPAPVITPPPESPPEVPPMQPPPYCEQDAHAFNARVRATYEEAGRDPDDQYPIWGDRAIYDYAIDALSWEASCAKHLRECRQALGLPTIQPPVQAVTDTWPRRGASYYTSMTDPRVDPPEFASRLRDAGCTHTRVWLIDAWAVGANGTGQYYGFVPWEVDATGKFDLWNVDQPYLIRLRAYVEAMNAAGILPELSGLDLYSWNTERKGGLLWVPNAARGPFQYNRQGIFYRGDDAFERIGQPSGEDAFLGHFYSKVVAALAGLVYTIELGNEMPEKELHLRLRDLWRAAGYTGSLGVNRNSDAPGQYTNMRVGSTYDRIAFHGKRDLGYLMEDYPEEPTYRTFAAFYGSETYVPARIVLSSDGCRKSTDVNDAYNYDALREVFRDAIARGFGTEHQSKIKLRSFGPENRIDLNDLETDWLLSLWR